MTNQSNSPLVSLASLFALGGNINENDRAPGRTAAHTALFKELGTAMANKDLKHVESISAAINQFNKREAAHGRPEELIRETDDINVIVTQIGMLTPEEARHAIKSVAEYRKAAERTLPMRSARKLIELATSAELVGPFVLHILKATYATPTDRDSFDEDALQFWRKLVFSSNEDVMKEAIRITDAARILPVLM